MGKRFSCGQYECCITGNKDLLGLIPDTWTKYQPKSGPSTRTVMVHLEEGMCEFEGGISDGWVLREDQNPPLAEYISNGKGLFALRYIAPFEIEVYVRKALDSYVRIGIHYGIMLALYQECIGLHGVTLLCGNEIIILSAPSGTGKTTLAKLLEKYCDAIVINGDFALLHPTVDGIVFEPTPFCGTSGRCLNHRLKVNRIVFLSQGIDNTWRELSGREAIPQFLSNVFIPIWDKELQEAVRINIIKCITMLHLNHYSFSLTQRAADIFVRRIAGQQ